MRLLTKLQRCGCSVHVTIPKQALAWLGWVEGEPILFELLEDHTVAYRKPNADDFTPKRARPVFLESAVPMPK